ncbi:hypothetical protein Tco_0702565 [Tanacetum coccineum]|uniref:Uncharacterized protein n=1 Tax=Tanacetum coccineum TaxID=301880 RepID=A0ABQ4XWB8_9ASTR
MIQPEPEDLPKDNPKLEIAVLSKVLDRVVLVEYSLKDDEYKDDQCKWRTSSGKEDMFSVNKVWEDMRNNNDKDEWWKVIANLPKGEIVYSNFKVIVNGIKLHLMSLQVKDSTPTRRIAEEWGVKCKIYKSQSHKSCIGRYRDGWASVMWMMPIMDANFIFYSGWAAKELIRLPSFRKCSPFAKVTISEHGMMPSMYDIHLINYEEAAAMIFWCLHTRNVVLAIGFMRS